MSRHTIELLDRMADVYNENSAIENVSEAALVYADYEPWRKEAEDEIRQWTRRRDKKLARLKKIVSELSPVEIDLIRLRYYPNKLRAQLLAIGVDAPW